MHIPDGYLGPLTYGCLWAVMVPVWMVASRRVKKEFKTSQVPSLAMASAFSLIAMMFTVPLPGGTTGHMTGSALIAILLGPWAGVLAASIALMIQAVVFGDGGITALGANCFNIAFVGAMTGYITYRIVTFLGARLKGGFVRPMAAAIAAYLSVNLGALFAALELGIQPWLSSGSPTPQYFPYPLHVAIPAVLLPHLTAVGLLEAVITVLVLLFIQRLQSGVTGTRKAIISLFFILFLFLAPRADAHDFWIEQEGKEFAVVFGHGTHREEFDPSKIKKVIAFDHQGKEISVTKEKKGKGVVLKPIESPSLMIAEIDNGYWSKTIYGWKNLPKRKASRVVEAIRSLNYSKVLLSWSEMARKPVESLTLDILPMEDPFRMKIGDHLPVRILQHGKPLTGVEVTGNDHIKIGTSDKDGILKLLLSKGHQLITVTYKEPLKDDPDADYLSITSTLTFEVKK